MLGNKPQHYAVVEAPDSFKKAPVSTSNICKVVDNLYMLWMCQWMWPYHVTASLIVQAAQSQMVLMQIPGNPRQKTSALCSGAVIEALDSFILTLTSVPNIFNMFGNLPMLCMNISVHPSMFLPLSSLAKFLKFYAPGLDIIDFLQ